MNGSKDLSSKNHSDLSHQMVRIIHYSSPIIKFFAHYFIAGISHIQSIIFALYTFCIQQQNTMSLSFSQRLSKIKRSTEPSDSYAKPNHSRVKPASLANNSKASDFQRQHSDLKSMLQMLQTQKNNSCFFTPGRDKSCGKGSECKVKTEQKSTKENWRKTAPFSVGSPDKKAKIKLRNPEQEMFPPETSSFLLKNLKYKNKAIGEPKESVPKSQGHLNTAKPAKRGIPNIGNTCYMNAVLQCLFHLKDFSQGIKCLREEEKCPVTHKYLSLHHGVTNMNETTPDLSALPLKKSVSKICSLFVDFQQEDAHEFLKQLLDSVHKEINIVESPGVYRVLDFTQRRENIHSLSLEYWNQYKRFDDSYIYDNLCGQVCNYVTCTNCGNTSVNFDNFLDLSIPLANGKTTLPDLLGEYFGEQTLSDFYVCSKCSQTSKKSKKRSELWRCPNYLIIQLKRSQFGKKNSDRIKLPVRCLDMKPFMNPSNRHMASKYNLQGVVLHRGRIEGGHYWAEVKDGCKWYSADDEMVSSVGAEQVIRQYEQEGSESAYILFYRSI